MSIFSRKVTYRTPGGNSWRIYTDLVKAPHCLIAGETGSGKTTVMEGMIYSILITSTPIDAQFIFIDTKRVSMMDFKTLPHVIEYADTVTKAETALTRGINIMENRFAEMQKKRMKEYTGADLYIVIDEAGDLLTSAHKKTFIQQIQHITMLGRAARVHLWLGSQVVTREVISTAIKANISTRVCLRTACAQDSRNICGVSGAELLPNPRTTGRARGFIRDGADVTLWNLPMYTDDERRHLLNYWSSPRNYKVA